MKLETIAGEWASRSNVRPLAKGGTSSRYFRMERACRPGFLNYGHTSRMSHLPGSRTNEKRSRPLARLPNVIIGNAGNNAMPRGYRSPPQATGGEPAPAVLGGGLWIPASAGMTGHVGTCPRMILSGAEMASQGGPKERRPATHRTQRAALDRRQRRFVHPLPVHIRMSFTCYLPASKDILLCGTVSDPSCGSRTSARSI